MAASVNNTFTLPTSGAEADRLAADLGTVANATGWKLAALIYARVRVQEQNGRPRTEKVNLDLLSPEQFAALGIRGLTSKTTVRAYWRAWNSAIIRGIAQPVSLGDTVTLPDRDFGDFYALAAASAGRHEPLTPPAADPLADEAAAPAYVPPARQRPPRVLERFYFAVSGLADNALKLEREFKSADFAEHRDALRAEHAEYAAWASNIVERVQKLLNDVLNEM